MTNFRRYKTVGLDELVDGLIAPPPKHDDKQTYRGRRQTVQQPQMAPKPIPIKPDAKAGLEQVQQSFQQTILKAPTPKRSLSNKIPTPQIEDKRSGAFILSTCPDQLNEYEQQEILQYNKVYYWGQKAIKKYRTQDVNYGYDDQKGDYLGVLKDHIAYRYELIQVLGAGSFGKVFRAYDYQNNQHVALKIVRNKKRFHRQGLVEVRILENLRKNDPNDHSSSLKLLGSFYFRQHLCLVTELYSINLYELLVRFNLKGLKMNIVKPIVAQCLNALCYSFNLNIIHADVKPENILLVKDNSTDIKVIDWGSGAYVGQTIYTYIQSRFYRAPEVILGLPYSLEIDVWSMGCVFAELAVGTPIFPGEDEHDQLGKICEYLGMPPQNMVQRSTRQTEFFQTGKLRTKHRPGTRQVRDFLRGWPADFVALVETMLTWDPKQRPTPSQLVQHPFARGQMQYVGQLGTDGHGEQPAAEEYAVSKVSQFLSGKQLSGKQYQKAEEGLQLPELQASMRGVK